MVDDTSVSKKVTKRKESGIHGKIYERKILALISLKCLLNKNIKDFWLISNPENVNKFDDMILLVEYQHGRKKLFMIQIKHKLKSDKPIPITQKLDSTDGDWSLKIYQNAFEEISTNNSFFHNNGITAETEKYYILYNNCKVCHQKENENLTLFSMQCKSEYEHFDFIDSSSNAENIFKLLNITGKYDESFLNRFYFFSNQLNESDVYDKIRNFLGGKNDVAESIQTFFFKWADPSNTAANKLHKIDIETYLLEIISRDMPLPVLLEGSVENKLTDIIKIFDVTVVSENYSSETIWREISNTIQYFFHDERINLSSWHEPVSQDMLKKMERSCFKYIEDFLTNRERLHLDITTKVLYFLMVSLRKVPYFIRTDNHLFETFKTCLLPLLSIRTIVFNIEKDILNFENLKVFNTLSDMNKMHFEQNNNKLKVSFQGKNYVQLFSYLSKYTKQNIFDISDVKKKCSVDDFIQLLHKPFQIGNRKSLPDYYVNRQLNAPVLNIDVLTEKEPIFIVMNSNFNREQNKKYKTIDLMVFVLFLHSHAIDVNDYNVLKATSDLNINLKLIKHIEKKRIFMLKGVTYNNQGFFEIVYSNSPIDILRPYLTFIPQKEEDILSVFNYSRINLICNNAGMGKSTFLNFLYSHFKIEEWTVHLELGKHSQVLKSIKTVKQLFQFVFQHQYSTVNPKLHNLFEVLYGHLKYKMIWLIDDYEEVNMPHLLNVFKDAANKGVRIWIVARPLLKIEFEDTFNVFAMELTEFSRGDQNIFFRKYLQQKKKNKPTIEKIMSAIQKTRNLFEDSFIGICQQTMMLAEIFVNFDGNWKEESHRINDLYEQFLNLKVSQYSENEKMFYIRTVSKLALKVFFRNSALAKIFDLEECDQDIKVFRSKYPKDFFIDGFEDDVPIFSHRTYAEFLSARWLVLTAKKQIEKETPSNIIEILKMLYFKELTTVRLFFDNILTSKLPIHSLIVNKQNSVMCDQHRIFSSGYDLLGRSIFHILSSYGNRYEIRTATEMHDLLRNVDEHGQVDVKGKNVMLKLPMVLKDSNEDNVCMLPCNQRNNHKISCIDHIKSIITDAVQQCPDICVYEIFQKDTFLNLLPTDYALLSGSLLELDTFLKYHASSGNEFNALEEEISEECRYFLLYHSIQNCFDNILAKIDLSGVNLIKVNPSHMSLLHLAVVSKNVHAIRELLKKHELTEWGEDEEGNTPLHVAWEKGELVVKALLDLFKTSTQFLNRKNKKGYCHLHILAQKGLDVWISRIIKTHPDILIDSQCYDGNTPFIIGIIYNRIKVADLLYTHGANVNHVNAKRRKALHYSSSKGFLECTKRLIKWGCKVNCKDGYGMTPLMKASTWGHITTTKYLLQNQAKVNECDSYKWTALHHAIKRKQLKIVTLLLERHANVNSFTDKGYTPLMIACFYNVPKAVELLIKHMADVNSMSNEKKTSLKIAISKKHTKCFVQLLA